MSAILNKAIVSFCMGLPSQYHEACNKAMHAGTIQSGMKKNFDDVEDRQTKMVDQQAKAIVGEDTMAAVGTAGFIAQSAKSHSLSMALPTGGMCSSLKTELKPHLVKLLVEWRF